MKPKQTNKEKRNQKIAMSILLKAQIKRGQEKILTSHGTNGHVMSKDTLTIPREDICPPTECK